MPRVSRAAAGKAVILIAALAGAFALAYTQGWFKYRELSTLAQAVRGARDTPAAAPLFVLMYVVATAFALPGSVLTLAGGALFGLSFGTLLNWLGATIGATVAYFLARVLGKDAVRGILGRHAEKLDKLTGEQGFLNLLRLRLIPIVPFNALNFGAGLVGVKARSYFAATALGIIPGTIVYTYFADALLSGAEGVQAKAFVRVAVAGGLLLLLSFVPTIARKLGWMPRTSAAAQVASAPAHADRR